MKQQDNATKLVEAAPEEFREDVRRAVALARERHGEQRREGGELHSEHVLRVGLACLMWALENSPERAREHTLVAILHDTLEDTGTADEELEREFGADVARAVRAVSHEEEEEPLTTYFARIKAGGSLAIVTKRFDRLDNFASLRFASRDFARRKVAEQREALPLWRELDPEGYPEIERAIRQLEIEFAD